MFLGREWVTDVTRKDHSGWAKNWAPAEQGTEKFTFSNSFQVRFTNMSFSENCNNLFIYPYDAAIELFDDFLIFNFTEFFNDFFMLSNEVNV